MARAVERVGTRCTCVDDERTCKRHDADNDALRAEVKRLYKMLDVCNAVHGHNVKLKKRLDTAQKALRHLVSPTLALRSPDEVDWELVRDALGKET